MLASTIVPQIAEQTAALGVDTLRAALAKVERRRFANDQEAFTQAEIDALSAWMCLQTLMEGTQTRAERSERNKAAWESGDRRKWGGERRQRDKRRGWRNFTAR